MKRGRPKGARSVVGVKLDDLNRFLKGEAVIPIEIKFAKALFAQNKVELSEFVVAEDETEEKEIPVQVTAIDA